MSPRPGLSWLSSITSTAAPPMRNVLRQRLQRLLTTNVTDAASGGLAYL
jgi:hypothetical protein